jgi:hypothetical protein
VGLAENHFTGTALEIFPNPAFDRINLRISGDLTNSEQLVITDLCGRPLREFEVHGDQDQYLLDISVLPQGAYILKIRGNAIVFMKKR